MSDLFTRLKQRKLIQWVIAYAGGAWLLLQLLSLLAQPFAWPDLVMRAAIVVLGVGFVAVIVLAWFHGEKGAQKAGGIELLMLGALLIVAATGVALVSRGRDSAAAKPDGPVAAPMQQAEQRSIAVLPFDNMSDVAGNEYFADGITEDILTNLSKVTSLRVISRTSVMRYKDTTLRTPEIARELNVAHILEGSVRRAGDQVRITAQLIRASDDAHLWANTYDRQLTNIFDIQTEIAKEIADALNARLTAREGQQIAARPTDNLEAYDKFLRARTLYSQLDSASTFEAVSLLREAVRLDPEFASAQAFLARSLGHSKNWHREYPRYRALEDSAIMVAKHAIASAPMNADGHSALGEVFRQAGRYEEAIASIKRALEIEPNLAWSIAEMGETLGPYGMGRAAEAIPWAQRGLSIDPGAPWMYELLGDAWRILGDFPKAEQAFESAERLRKSGPNYSRIRLTLQQGDTARAAALIAARNRTASAPLSAASLSWTYAEAGFAAEAQRYARLDRNAFINTKPGDRRLRDYRRFNEQVIRGGSKDPARHYILATYAGIEGDAEAVIDHLERYVEAGGRDDWLLRRHVLFARVQNEPRMHAVLERIRRDIAAQRKQLQATRLAGGFIVRNSAR